jgi:hypothetical protein
MSDAPKIGSLEADRQTLQALKNAGANLTKPTHVLFYLYFETQELADKAAASGRTSELEATVRPAASGGGWLVLLEGTMVPSESAMHATSARLLGLATSLGGEYDGWEAAVTQ